MTSQLLDEKLLGRPLPGTISQRLELLNWLEDIVDEEGEEQVRHMKDHLLSQAQSIVDQGLL